MRDLRAVPGGAAGRALGEAAAAAMGALERRLRPQPQQNLRCPRCDSLNTKFCYYNNYNLSQPRHFCKSCRRYWTNGGVLRNVPVGGGCRKPKRSPSSKSPKSSSDKDHRHDSTAAPGADICSVPAHGAADTREPITPPGTNPGFDPTALHREMGAPPAPALVFPETGSFPGTDVHLISSPQLPLLPARRPKAATPPAAATMLDVAIGMPGMTLAPTTYVDEMAHVGATPLPEPDGAAAGPPLATLDWPAGGYYMSAGLLDAVPASVAGDHGGAWNYQSQWGEIEIDPLLFIP